MEPHSAACNLQEFFYVFCVQIFLFNHFICLCRYFYLIILLFCVDIFIQLFYLYESTKTAFNHSSRSNA